MKAHSTLTTILMVCISFCCSGLIMAGKTQNAEDVAQRFSNQIKILKSAADNFDKLSESPEDLSAWMKSVSPVFRNKNILGARLQRIGKSGRSRFIAAKKMPSEIQFYSPDETVKNFSVVTEGEVKIKNKTEPAWFFMQGFLIDGYQYRIMIIFKL
jgi:hypothetical protein